MQHVEASVPNEGARLLRKKMADEKLSQGEIARRVGVGVDVVGRWLKEAHRPRGDLAAKLEDKCQIPAGAWWQAPADAEAAPEAAPPSKTGTEGG